MSYLIFFLNKVSVNESTLSIYFYRSYNDIGKLRSSDLNTTNTRLYIFPENLFNIEMATFA